MRDRKRQEGRTVPQRPLESAQAIILPLDVLKEWWALPRGCGHGDVVTLVQVSPRPSSFVMRHQQCRHQHGCSRTDRESQERGSSLGLRHPTCARYPRSLIHPGWIQARQAEHPLYVQVQVCRSTRMDTGEAAENPL